MVTVWPTLCAWMAALSWVADDIATPLTAVIVSPVVMPAFAAGKFGNVDATGTPGCGCRACDVDARERRRAVDDVAGDPS